MPVYINRMEAAITAYEDDDGIDETMIEEIVARVIDRIGALQVTRDRGLALQEIRTSALPSLFERS